MRQFASALALGRGGKSETTSTTSAPSAPTTGPRVAKSRSASLFAKAPKTPLETTGPALRSRPVLTPGSSCSSEGSASLRTPEDEGLMPPFSKSDEKKRWSTWFGWRKPSDKGQATEGPVDTNTDGSAPQPVSAGSIRDSQQRPLPRIPRQSVSDSDDADEGTSSESSENTEGSTVISTRPILQRVSVSQARSNLRTLLHNSLNQVPPPPPVVETPTARFPRSSMASGSVQPTLSLESTIHVRRMLWRLDHQTLSETEVRSIAGLARRPQPKDASRNRSERKTDDEMISYASMRVGQFSRGLRKWALRPCFEQRCLVWAPDEKGDVNCKAVMGVDRQLAVCDLEFCEGTEALAGLQLDDRTFEQILFTPMPEPKGSIHKPTTRKQSPPRTTPRKTSFHSSPSPLRLDHASPAEPVLSPVSSVVSTVPSRDPILDVRSSVPTEKAPAPSEKASAPELGASRSAAPSEPRSVRFVDDNDADGIPLGYAIRARKRREEKEKFLRAEREKRAKELQAREAEERQKRAAEEQQRREEERRRIEEEKRAREERMQAKYNEEIAASRQRRENARLGVDNYTNIREMHQREERDNGRTYSRPAYDVTPPPVQAPRRRASDITAPIDNSIKSSNAPRPASIAESGEDRRRSMAPSAYKPSPLSTDDVRPTVPRQQAAGTDLPHQQQVPSRPPSIASSSSRPVSVLRTQSVPNQMPLMAYPMMPVMPPIPVPPMPLWNMPLLPPNAPFMMQQYSRSPSPGSNPHSRDPSPSSRRQSTLQPTASPSHRHQSLHPSSSSSRPQPGAADSRHSRYPSRESAPQTSGQSRGNSNNTSQRPPRSTSYSTLQQSRSQPIYRDDRSQTSRHGSYTNLGHMDTKRRTTMM
ncbi:uncharacterized protein FOMMEDRAFT_141814 [Fomitiporia mediterranea MF3/22]|uniref:uncharacterized protein n=1 Tax=Fomitiporia mediterranea (strain MF3/22) TaxID=694068 RepID=UPI0004407EC6|nr:uncharacterized protein FOMMEDRAFT_141814 [Fomitiporia mediterranea MF3/22]EJD01098.1 hypothetical protein FOMMEDRAFT_141814 [Fomitiporia mediterranea MF3/22]